MNQEDNIQASIAAYQGDEEPLAEIMYPLLDWVHQDYFYFKRVDDARFTVDKTMYNWPN